MANGWTPFKIIWPDFCIVDPTDSFQHPFKKFYCYVHRLTPFNTICIVYPTDSFQDYLGVICIHNAKMMSYDLERSKLVLNNKSGQIVLKGVNWWLHNEENR